MQILEVRIPSDYKAIGMMYLSFVVSTGIAEPCNYATADLFEIVKLRGIVIYVPLNCFNNVVFVFKHNNNHIFGSGSAQI